MHILLRGAVALMIGGGALSVTAAPAQAHDDYRYGWRGDRYDRRDRDDYRRWYRHHHRDWRSDRYRRHGWRDSRRCWTEWRYDRYRHRDVRVRYCR